MNQVRVSHRRFLTIIKERRLTQTEAADVLGIKQPNVSSLMRNRAGGFSVRQDVEISVRKARKARPRRRKAICPLPAT
jgi:predicted XRE-type DNA-binding protein